MAEHAVAQILNEQKAAFEILRVDRRHAEAERAQRGGDRHEWAHVLGEMRDAAVRQSVADRGAVGLARPVHEDGAVALGARVMRA